MSGLHKHEPVPREKMEKASPQYTICEVLREIYRLTDDEDIRYRCRVATAMAKAMNRRLCELNSEWSDNFFERNPNLVVNGLG